jgi:glyoxylase-like metal-dependent hydrolase (beta-lactamase superfamily II)
MRDFSTHDQQSGCFLDAYIDRVPALPPIGVSVDQITRADWIVVGHSHFDHLYGAERIAKATGATIIGSYETVRSWNRKACRSRK